MLRDSQYFIGDARVKMDAKKRIWLPKFSHRLIKDQELALTHEYQDDEFILKVYLAKKYEEILARYNELLKSPNLTPLEFKKYHDEINETCFKLDQILQADKQYRILVSPSIIRLSNWQPGEDFNIKGNGEFLTVKKASR